MKGEIVMFVLSVHSKKLRVAAIGIAVLICLGGILFSVLHGRSSGSAKRSLAGAEPEERIRFIESYGWTVAEEPLEVTEILIPEEFDEVYRNYNEIQLEEGFDLTSCCGMRVKRWTYSVTNYPGYTDSKLVRINLLVCDGVIVGGDVCSVELGGFMHGFTNPCEPETTEAETTAPVTSTENAVTLPAQSETAKPAESTRAVTNTVPSAR